MTVQPPSNRQRFHRPGAARKPLRHAATKPVQRRLLIPLAAVFLLLVGGFGAVLLHMQHASVSRFSQQVLDEVSDELAESVGEQSDALDALKATLLRDACLSDALKAQDRDRLLADCEPIFTLLRAEHGITHFYLHLPDRVNLLRVHKPEKNGDLIDRLTAREAERTGQTASGIELGPLGTLTVRAVRPVFDGDTLIGYLELGKEIEDILASIHDEHGIELAVTIRKTALKREKWEAGMKMLGREADWNQFAEDVLIYASLPRFPDEAKRLVGEPGHTDGAAAADAEFDGKTWRVLSTPFTDVSGAEVGDLLIFHDTSEAMARFNRVLLASSGAALVLLTALLSFLYIALRRVDHGIVAREADLAMSERFQRTLTETSPDFIFVLDRDMTIRSVNRLQPGHREEDVVGRPALAFVPPEHQDRLRAAFGQALETGELRSAETSVRLPDGEHFFLNRLNPLPEADEGHALVLISTDITERKRAEEEIVIFKRFAEASAQGFAMANLDGTITYANPALCRMLGEEKPEDACGKTFVLYYTEEHRKRIEEEVIPTVMREGQWVGELALLSKKGATTPTLENIFLIRDENGEPRYLADVMTDITERKQAEKDLRKRTYDLGERVKELNCLYGIASLIERRGISLGETLQGVVELIPPSWQFPEITCARIVVEGNEFRTENFKDTIWKQGSDIVVYDERLGRLEICYLEEKPESDEGPFLKEERSLIDAVAERLGRIIERRRAEEELRRSESSLTEAQRIAHLGNWGWDIQTNELLWSDEIYRIFGLVPQEFDATYQAFLDRVHPDDRDRLTRSVEEALGNLKPYRIEHRIVLPDGSERVVHEEAKVSFDAAGKPVRMVGTIQDITERKRAEKELAAIHARLNFLVSGSPAVIYSCRAGGDWGATFISENIRNQFGYQPREFLETPEFWARHIHPNDKERVLKELSQLMDKGQHAHEYRFLHRDGDYRWVHDEVRLICDKEGNPVECLGYWADVTERKQAEEEHRKLEDRMRQAQKLESLGVLAGGIAHDFNNLLMGIMGNAELALSDVAPSSGTHDSIMQVLKASQRAADLTKQMLAYSGRGKFVIQLVNLSEIVRDMGQMLASSIFKKAVLKHDLTDDLPPIEADATQIRQIIMNLVINASEAIGDENGVISIATGTAQCDRAYLSEGSLDQELPEGAYAYIEISDTGCGMDKETIERIYDPFFTTKFAGRGLGMAAVSGIVRGHKGAIKVQSEAGRGTTFRILFPTVEEPFESPVEERVETNDWRGSGTILFVDDEPAVRDVGKKMLEIAGFEVLTAVDGEDALKVFRERSDDVTCVLLDMMMPRMDGEETFQELCNIRSDIPVIMISGYNEQEVINRFTSGGLAGFIQKPYHMDTLKGKLQEVLG